MQNLKKMHLDLFTRQNLLGRYLLRIRLGNQSIHKPSLKKKKSMVPFPTYHPT